MCREEVSSHLEISSHLQVLYTLAYIHRKLNYITHYITIILQNFYIFL